MHNILDFIDSEDIRKYNENTVFSPAQKALLAVLSRKRTISEKMEYLRYLSQTYTEEEFETGDIIRDSYYSGEYKIKHVVEATLSIWEDCLAVNQKGYIYAAQIASYDSLDREIDRYRFFPAFEMAVHYLKTCYDEDYSEDEFDPRIEIKQISLNEDADTDTFYLAPDMEIIDIDYGSSRWNKLQTDDEEVAPLDMCMTYIPVPFKPGDIVKIVRIGEEDLYGAISTVREKPDVLTEYNCSMYLSLDCYDADDDVFYWTDDTYILDLEYCTEKDFEVMNVREKEKLLDISAVRRGEKDFFSTLLTDRHLSAKNRKPFKE